MVRIFLYIAYTRSENQTDGWKLRNREKQKAMPPQTEGNDVKGIVDDGKCRLFFPHLISLIALGGKKKFSEITKLTKDGMFAFLLTSVSETFTRLC